MGKDFALDPIRVQQMTALSELAACNEISGRFGLTLSEAQMLALVEQRFAALRDTGRIEFGEGVLKKLVFAFSDSPYLEEDSYAETLGQLQDLFYEFKNEAADKVTDDELIACMKRLFDGPAAGSVDYMAELTLADLYRGDWKEQ